MADFSLVVTITCAVVALLLLQWSRERPSLTTEHLPATPASMAPSHGETDPAQYITVEARLEADCHAEAQQLIASVPELQALYAALGYSPQLESQATRLLRELSALIRTEIPDFAAFYRVMHHTQTHLKESMPTQNAPALVLQECARQACAAPLWQAVVAAGQDQAHVLALLNREPVYEQLPFIEQVPFYKDGTVIWRTPVEVTVLRKRPADVTRFGHLLEALEALFTAPGVLLNTQARQEVLHEIARVRRDLQRPHGYLPTPLQALARKVSMCLQQPPNATAHGKREALDRFLAACVSVRRTYGGSITAGRTLSAASLRCFREAAQQQAQYYLQRAWMHTPWLTGYVLTTLLDSDLAALPATTQRLSPAPGHMLALIRAEVASGNYDRNETIRRLRQQEDQGVYVHSFAYPLLRLHRTPAATPAAARVT
jgi:hypothetical protein